MKLSERLHKPGYKLVLILAAFLYAGHIEYQSLEQSEKINSLEYAKHLSDIQEKRKTSEYAAFLKKYHHPAPLQTASAIRKAAKKDKVMLALAAQEQAGVKTKSRDGKGSVGIGQVRSKYHGRVPSDAADQVRQSEAILDRLIEANNSVEVGLARYNGSGRQSVRYAKSVLEKLEETP